MDDPKDKIFLDCDHFSPMLESLRCTNSRIVFTNGCFDILHRGHCEYLYAAKRMGSFLVVGINTDDSIRRLKGPKRPILGLYDRAYALACLFFVDAVIPFDENTPLELIKFIKPHILVKGADYKLDQIVGAREVLDWGGRVETVELVPNRSTTELISLIIKANDKSLLATPEDL